MRKKIMLIAGCSHTAGSEIDGTEDSPYNREHSYGGVLASLMGYKPINMAEPGACNSTIARGILEWFHSEYDPNTMEVFVVVGWTESIRLEVPSMRVHWYDQHCKSWDYFPETSRHYWRINMGWPGHDPEEKEIIPIYQRYMVDNEKLLEISTANSVLQIQYFLKSIDVEYVMCNTMKAFSTDYQHIKFYVDCIDQTKYFNLMDQSQAFFWKYKELGYENPKAKYWHHNEIPHKMFADEIFNFIERNKNVHSTIF